MSTFYNTYIKLCASVGKSASKVAEEIGLSRTSPHGWKNGKLPNDVTQQKLSEYFGVTKSELMGRGPEGADGETQNRSEYEQKKEPTGPKASRLVDAGYDLLSDEHRQIVDNLIANLLTLEQEK